MPNQMVPAARQALIRELEEQARNGGKRDMAALNEDYQAMLRRRRGSDPESDADVRDIDPLITAPMALLLSWVVLALCWISTIP